MPSNNNSGIVCRKTDVRRTMCPVQIRTLVIVSRKRGVPNSPGQSRPLLSANRISLGKEGAGPRLLESRCVTQPNQNAYACGLIGPRNKLGVLTGRVRKKLRWHIIHHWRFLNNNKGVSLGIIFYLAWRKSTSVHWRGFWHLTCRRNSW